MDANKAFQARVDEEALEVRARQLARQVVPVMSECELCHSTDRLERHHPDIIRRPKFVRVLCRTCHTKLHKGRRYMRPILPIPDLPSDQYWTGHEAAAYLRFPSYAAFRSFRSRHGILKGFRMGRRVLFTKAQLDEAMAQLAERRPAPARIRVR